MVKKYITQILGPLVLGVITVLVVLSNYEPGTILTGWDNFHSEFNFFVNLKRAFFALWQEQQGLGLLGGMAHAADIPRQLILATLSIVIPTNLIRYFWTFAMLFIGPLGAYFLVEKALLRGQVASKPAAFASGLFYLLNLATVQYFFTPFETFVSFYGFLPWLIYLGLRCLERGSRRDFLLFFLISFLATPSFIVQTLFVVYLVTLSVFALEAVLRQKLVGAKRAAKLFLVVLFANSFWLLPAGYFSLTSSQVVTDSKINSIATPETQLMNQDTGKLSDIALLKGFWFNYLDVGYDNKFDYLISPWRDYLSLPKIEIVGYGLFLASVCGLFLFLAKKTKVWGFSPILLFFVGYLMLSSSNPPLGFVFNFLTNSFPLFGEIFRSVFTKWSIVFALSLSLGLGLLIYSITKLIKKRSIVIPTLLGVVISVFIIVVTLPVFEGNLIMRSGKLKFPSSYQELFQFFNGEPKEARIALFPIQSFWGWSFYDWGYRGSGFLWYGIDQPILDRAFDVWSKYNETYYYQVSTAFYNNDASALKSVFDKYDVTYTLIDKSVIAPGREKEYLAFERTEEMLKSIGAKKVFERDSVLVYELENHRESFVYAPQSFSIATSDSDYARRDLVYEEVGDYVETSLPEYSSATFPFSDLFREEITTPSYEDFGEASVITIVRSIEGKNANFLNIPEIESGSKYNIPSQINYDGTFLSISFDSPVKASVDGTSLEMPELADLVIEPRVNREKLLLSINGQIVEVEKDKETNAVFVISADEVIDVEIFDTLRGNLVDISKEFLSAEVNICWQKEGGGGVVDGRTSGDLVSIRVKDAAGCFAFRIGDLGVNGGVLSVSLPYKSYQASRPDFCVVAEGPDYKCENDEIFYAEMASDNWSAVSRRMVLPGNTVYWINIAARPPDAEGEEWTIEYKSPKIETYPLIFRTSFDTRVWTDLKKGSKIPLSEKPKTLKLSIFAPGKKIDFVRSGKKEAENCDVFERGSVEKIIDAGIITYKTQDKSAICDFVPLAKTLTTMEHLIRFTGYGVSGRPLKIYLFNKGTLRNDLEVLLSHGEFDKTFSVVSWPNIAESDHVLNLEGRSLGSEVSETKIKNVFVYDVPLSWISKFSLGSSETKPMQNALKVNTSKKIGSYIYQAKVDVKEEGGLLVLSQGYDPGWVAYTSGLKIKHVKVNGWANGWVIPQGTTPDSQQITLYLVFWPQYLEFLGFAMLLVGLGVVLLGKDVVVDKEGVLD